METYGLESLGIINAAAVYRNLTPAQLTEHALRRGEGKLSNTGALVVKTGKYTGRSANDKFIVDTPAVHDEIAVIVAVEPADDVEEGRLSRTGRSQHADEFAIAEIDTHVV